MSTRPDESRICNTHPCLPAIYKNEVVVQGSTLVSNKARTYSEASSVAGGSFNGAYVYESKGVEILDTATDLIIKPTGRYGDYDNGGKVIYILTLNEVDRALLYVNITVAILPETSVLLSTSGGVSSFLERYRPPSFADIFHSWERFGDNRHQGRGPFYGDASTWYLSGGNVHLGNDATNPTGFVSPDSFSKYTFECTMRGGDPYGDTIGLVIAYMQTGGTPHMLVVSRDGARIMNHGWAGYTYSLGRGVSVVYQTTTHNNHQANPILRILPSGYKSATTGAYSWNAGLFTRVRVERDLNTVKILCSAFQSENVYSGETIIINLNDYPQLSWVKHARPYGYFAQSSPAASFRSTTFDSDEHMKTVVCTVDTGESWKWVTPPGTWVKQGTYIWDVFGYPRYIRDANTNLRYLILEDRVQLITDDMEDPI